MTVKEVVEKYEIQHYVDHRDGKDKIKVSSKHEFELRRNKADYDFIMANRPEVIEESKAFEAAQEIKRAEDEKHILAIKVILWEVYTVYIDDRKDLDEQFELYADMYKISAESVKEAYNKALVTIRIKEEERERVELEKNEKYRLMAEKAAQTNKKQELRTYKDDCDDPSEECDMDFVTEWVEPDGTISHTRIHTW